MAHGYRPVVRDQQFLLAPDMRDWLGPDHLVWTVLDVVAGLDTSAFHAGSRRGSVGRAGYDPDMLLGLECSRFFGHAGLGCQLVDVPVA